MLLEKLNIIITLVATLVMTVFCIIDGVDMLGLSIRLVVTIVVFFIAGSIVKSYFVKLFKKDVTPAEPEENTEPEPEQGVTQATANDTTKTVTGAR